MKLTPLALALALGFGANTAMAQASKGEEAKSGAAQVTKPAQEAGLDTKPARQTVLQITSDWPEVSRIAVHQMLEKYGPPAEATPTRVIWFDNGPWKRTVVSNVPVNHDFPMPHQDVMEQTITYQVPPDKFDELAEYDGSVSVDRTRGEISARCDAEAANFIAINLAHDLVTGKRTVEEARKQYADLIIAHMTKAEPVAYAQKLTFEVPNQAGFSDKSIIPQDVIAQIKEKKQAMAEKVLGKEAAAGATK